MKGRPRILKNGVNSAITSAIVPIARITGKSLDQLVSIFTAMDKLENDYGVKFVLTCSAAKEDLPEFVLKHV